MPLTEHGYEQDTVQSEGRAGPTVKEGVEQRQPHGLHQVSRPLKGSVWLPAQSVTIKRRKKRTAGVRGPVPLRMLRGRADGC
jgi:hypothetical protein